VAEFFLGRSCTKFFLRETTMNAAKSAIRNNDVVALRHASYRIDRRVGSAVIGVP
jgi:hypothetical protein